jgi:hypothetical protein
MDLAKGTKVKISNLSGALSNKTGVIVDTKEIALDGKGVPKLSGHYKPIDWTKEYAIKLDNGEYVTMFKNRVEKVEANLKKTNLIAQLKGLGIPTVKGSFVKKSKIMKALARVLEIEREYNKIKADMDKLIYDGLEFYIEDDTVEVEGITEYTKFLNDESLRRYSENLLNLRAIVSIEDIEKGELTSSQKNQIRDEVSSLKKESSFRLLSTLASD